MGADFPSGIAGVAHDASHRALSVRLFDSGELDVRLEELHLCLTLGWLGPGAWFAIHDTSRVRSCDDTGTPAPITQPFWEQFTLLQDQQQLDVVEFPLSRGMVVGQVGGRW